MVSLFNSNFKSQHQHFHASHHDFKFIPIYYSWTLVMGGLKTASHTTSMVTLHQNKKARIHTRPPRAIIRSTLDPVMGTMPIGNALKHGINSPHQTTLTFVWSPCISAVKKIRTIIGETRWRIDRVGKVRCRHIPKKDTGETYGVLFVIVIVPGGKSCKFETMPSTLPERASEWQVVFRKKKNAEICGAWDCGECMEGCMHWCQHVTTGAKLFSRRKNVTTTDFFFWLISTREGTHCLDVICRRIIPRKCVSC